MNYFHEIPPKRWKYDDAITWYSLKHPQRQAREINGLVVKDLREIAERSTRPEKVSKANELLKSKERNKRSSTAIKRTMESSAEASSSKRPAIVQYTGSNINDFRRCNFGKSSNTFNINAQDSVNPSSLEQSVGRQESKKQDEVDDENQETGNDSDPTSEPSVPLRIRPMDFRERVFQLATNALRNGSLTVDETAQLASYKNTFSPQSLGQWLDVLASHLLSCNLQETSFVVALKMALSRVLCCLNPSVLKVYKEVIKDVRVWDSAAAVTANLPTGLMPNPKRIFAEVIERGRGEDGKLKKKLLEIAVCKKKLELLESDNVPEPQSLQVLDIISAIVNNFPEIPCNRGHIKGTSETTFYRKFAQILDIIMRDSSLDIDDGEHVCKASKDILRRNMRFDGGKKQWSTFGRRIDLILTSSNTELSTSEWKRDNLTLAMALKQQCKNVRMNKAILTSMLDNPIPDHLRDEVFCLGMDWSGDVGYMFYVKEFEDVYITQSISALKLPKTIDDIDDFLPTMDKLYVWKNHHERLSDILLPAVSNKRSEELLGQLIWNANDEASVDERAYSPNVFFTPNKKRSAAATDYDLSDID